MTDFIASNTTELSAALASARGGDIIRLAAGNYGDYTISSKVFSSQVTITSLDASRPAEFHSLDVANSSYLKFDGVNVTQTPTMATTSNTAAVAIDDSSNIIFWNGKIVGGNAINGVPADAEKTDASGNVQGFPTGTGFVIQHSTDINIAGNDISQFNRGILLGYVDSLTIFQNDIHDLRRTGILGAGLNNVLVDSNHIHDANPWRLGQTPNGDHGDYLAFWVDTNQTTESRNIRIVNNVMEQGDGQALLGMWLHSSGSSGIGFRDVVVANNAILDGNFQGIALRGVTNGLVEHNVLLQTTGGDKDEPGILIEDGSKNIVTRENLMASYGDTSGSTGAQANTEVNNTIVQDLNPDLAGFYSKALIEEIQNLADKSLIYATGSQGLLGAGLVRSVTRFMSDEYITLHTAAPGVLVTGTFVNDRLVGGGGGDTLDSGGGQDTLIGGAGDDTYYVSGAQTVITELAGDGIDTVVSKVSYTLGANVENLILSTSRTTGWSGTGNDLNNVITGNEGANPLDGGAGSDTIDGAGGADTITGGAGDDSLAGGAGADKIDGGDGADTISTGAGAATVDGGAGADSILGGDGQTYLRGGDGDDYIVGGSAFNDMNGNVGNDTIFGGASTDWVVGGKGDDELHAGTGNQIVYGNLGNDTLFGGAGTDTLRGGQGDDVVFGGSAADWISGDLGTNRLTGGGGADIFHTGTGGGVDVVLDFRASEGDRVLLDSGTTYSVSQVGSDTVISITGGARMTLAGVEMSTLKSGWIFGA